MEDEEKVEEEDGEEDTSSDGSTVHVSGDDDVGHSQVGHGVLDDGEGVKVSGGHDIPNVTMHEDLARAEAEDLVGRHAGVGASDVEEGGLLGSTHLVYRAKEGEIKWRNDRKGNRQLL